MVNANDRLQNDYISNVIHILNHGHEKIVLAKHGIDTFNNAIRERRNLERDSINGYGYAIPH